MPVKCPSCGLYNTESAERCDCGHAFSGSPKTSRSSVAVPPVPTSPGGAVFVKIADIDMPFASMVSFMLKWSIASIPAMVILIALGFLIGGVFGAIWGIFDAFLHPPVAGLTK
jgi:hypothetical protein